MEWVEEEERNNEKEVKGGGDRKSCWEIKNGWCRKRERRCESSRH